MATVRIMQASREILRALPQLLTEWLNDGDGVGWQVFLVKNSFAPGPTLSIASLVPASFTGSDPIFGIGLSLQQDPETLQYCIRADPFLQSWAWRVSTNDDLPQTIYGAAFAIGDTSVLWASMLLPRPITLTGEPQYILIEPEAFRFSLSSLSLG
jgi:hypothetical protein